MNTLPEGEVHLWVAFPDEWASASQIDFARDILDDGEISRMERFRFPEHRNLFLVSHLLVRRALSHYSDTPPGVWRFANDENGKPGVDPVAGALPLSFNLAHTEGLAVVGVAAGIDIGVDVERTDRPVDAERLSRRFFSTEETAMLKHLPPGRLDEQFPRYWTLKEAYIKALGLGLSQPLDSFTFRLTGGSPCRIDFSAVDPQDLRKWRFALIEPRRSYVVALCAASIRHTPTVMRCRRAFPSGRSAPLSAALLGLSAGVVCTPGP